MEALLGLGLGKGLGLDAPGGGSLRCNSVAELHDQLRNLIASKTSQHRAEHVAETFVLPSHVEFDVPVSDGGENQDPEKMDGSLTGTRPAAGAAPSPAPMNGGGAQPSRQIKAIDTLLNQPQNDPVAQASVARLLIGQIGAVDRSTWTVRHVSRNTQGWTFTYHCKDSWQSWTRQVAKKPAKMAIGEWSAKDGQDPVNMSRPAFDCRGIVRIAFVRSNRCIEVTYEHTCLHTTVAKLAELLAPPAPPPPPRVPAVRKEQPPKTPKTPKTPKAPKTAKETKTPRSTGRKRRNEDGDEAGSNPQPQNKSRKRDSSVNRGAVESGRAAGTASAEGEVCSACHPSHVWAVRANCERQGLCCCQNPVRAQSTRRRGRTPKKGGRRPFDGKRD